MLLSKSSLGISFWDDRVDLLHLNRFFGKTTVVNRLSMPFVYGMKREEFERDVSAFMKANRLQRIMTYVALPRRDVVLLNLELPGNVEENLREVVGYELDNYTPFSVDTAYFDFQNLGHTVDGSKVRILLTAIEKERLNYYLELLKGVGLKPISMEISSTAIARTIPFDSLSGGKNAVLYIGANTCEISFHNEKNLEYSRAFDITSPELNLGKSQVIDTILKEYKRVFPSGFGEQEIKKVVVLGDGISDEEFLKEISNAIGKEVVRVKTFKGIDSDGSDIQLQRAALGCALRGLYGDTAAMNFLAVKVDRDKTPRVLRFAAIILFIILVSLWVGEFVLRVKKEIKTLTQIKEKVMLLERAAISVEGLKKEIIVMEERLPQLNNFSKRRVIFLSFFKELTDVIPSNTYLTMLKYHDNEIEIVGRSASAVSLLSLLEASPVFKDVEFSATVKRREAVRERSGGRAVIAGGETLPSISEDIYLENFSIKAKLEGM
ncbi:MAG: pilus assembly protein PilM [Nitrospinae bacterium]|nr:pilus assembly protein PilM [Nitrospinota bacterium]